MASTTVPAKIVLKSTTKMSLSDRFTAIQKMSRPPPPVPQEVRATMSANQQSSQANRRLAQQMANRPAVKAALGRPMMAPPQMKSLKQRLGPSNIKARLSLSNGSVPRGAPRGAPRGRGRGMQRGRGRGGFTGGFTGGPMAAGGGGEYVARGARGGRGRPRGRGFVRGRGFTPRIQDDDRWFPRGRGRGRSDWPTDWSNRGGRGGGPTDRGRGMRGGRGRGRGGGRGRGRGSSFSREQLDNQLEEYMSKTKSHLNSELDVYMAQADTL